METLDTSGYPQLLRVIRYVRNRWRLRNALKGVAFLLLFGLAALAISTVGIGGQELGIDNITATPAPPSAVLLAIGLGAFGRRRRN